MFSRIRARLTYANVMSTIAVFFAVGGASAYAINEWTGANIQNETLTGADIKGTNGTQTVIGTNGSLTGADMAGQPAVAATGQPFIDGTLTTNDIADGKLRGTDMQADTLTGGQINESTLNLGGFFSAAGVASSGCTADSGEPTTCAVTTLTIARPGRILVNATSEWNTFHLDDTDGFGSEFDEPREVRGRCQIRVDGTAVGANQIVGERQQDGVESNHPFGGTMALTALSGVLPAGTYAVGVDCTEVDGDLDFGNTNLTAALVDDGTAPATLRAAPAPAGAPDEPDSGKQK